MTEEYLLNSNNLIEYITENEIDLVITLNQSSHTTFKKYSTNLDLKSYNELIINERFQKDVLKKEINFKYESAVIDVNVQTPFLS